jgi:hypothetical protein
MPNHGAVTVGADAPTAVMFADLLEHACRSLGAYPYCHLAACVAPAAPVPYSVLYDQSNTRLCCGTKCFARILWPGQSFGHAPIFSQAAHPAGPVFCDTPKALQLRLFCWWSARIHTLRYSSRCSVRVLKSAASASGGNHSCMANRERPLALLAGISTAASHRPSALLTALTGSRCDVRPSRYALGKTSHEVRSQAASGRGGGNARCSL